MQHSKLLVSQALRTLCGNLDRTGDPLGLKRPYWHDWADDFKLPARGENLLFTARMYPMLPYVVQATEMTAAARPLLPALGVKALARLAEVVTALAAEPLLRIKARKALEIRRRATDALTGMTAALQRCGQHVAYLGDEEPYSGVLLYDLGMAEAVRPVVRKTGERLAASGARTIITTDPHTTFMLKEIYPQHLPGFTPTIRHYLEVLAETDLAADEKAASRLPRKVVLHDSCVMTRDLGIIDAVRTVLLRLGVEVVEPRNAKCDTACCGGPVEYAYPALSRSVAAIRSGELAEFAEDAVVTCPICLINLMKHEAATGMRVWDAGELLFQAFGRNGA